MSAKHELTENGEIFISHVLAKKRFKVSKKELNDGVKAGRIRLLNREVTRLPHQLMNDRQLELHFFHAGDVESWVKKSKESGS